MLRTDGGSLNCWRQICEKALNHTGRDASAKGGANDQECGRQCWAFAQTHEANTMEDRITDPGEKKKKM